MWWMWEQTRELLESIRYIWVTLSWGFTSYILIKRQWFYGFQLQNRIGESEHLWKLLSSIRNLWEFWNSYSLLINHTQKSCPKEIWINVVSSTQKLGSSRTQPASAIRISVKVVAHCTIVFDYKITRQALPGTFSWAYVDCMFFRDEFKFGWIFTEQNQISSVKDTCSLICNPWFLSMRYVDFLKENFKKMF